MGRPPGKIEIILYNFLVLFVGFSLVECLRTVSRNKIRQHMENENRMNEKKTATYPDEADHGQEPVKKFADIEKLFTIGWIIHRMIKKANNSKDVPVRAEQFGLDAIWKTRLTQAWHGWWL